MDPRKDFIPFKPLEEWYEDSWLRPKPAKQSTGSRLPSGVMAFFQRASALFSNGPHLSIAITRPRQALKRSRRKSLLLIRNQ